VPAGFPLHLFRSPCHARMVATNLPRINPADMEFVAFLWLQSREVTGAHTEAPHEHARIEGPGDRGPPAARLAGRRLDRSLPGRPRHLQGDAAPGRVVYL